MAAIYANAQGQIQAFYSTWAIEQDALSSQSTESGPGIFTSALGSALLSAAAPYAASAKATPTVIDFDESTNAALVADILANPLTYSAPTVNAAPQLQKNGAPAAIAAPSEMYSARTTILAGITEATIEQAVTALWAGTATTAQSQKTIAYLCVKLRIAGII